VTIAGRLLIAAALLGAASPSPGQNSPAIIAARRAGAIGERYDGYLGYTASASVDVRRQVSAVNIKRRSLYTSLAARRGATVAEVGIAAGCELLGSVRAGEAYMLSDGAWRTRGASEAAPVPAYCGH
jgi:uncharacterized protein YdbL (DUF1318 family)